MKSKISPSIDNLELSHNILNTEMLSYNDNQFLYFLKHLCDQQLGIKNNIEFVVEPDQDVLPTITGVLCIDAHLVVTIKQSQSRIVMNRGDVLIFPSEMQYHINGEQFCKIFKIGYENKININDGSKKFKVTATLIDKYEIDVSAENEEEAISKAKEISISKWNHLDLYPETKERKIIRYAKWNNFSANTID